MKTININKIISVLILAVTFSACIQDGEFDLPNLEVEEPNVTVNSNITAVKSALAQEFNSSGNLTSTFFENLDNPTFIEGYVVSSDATGNFFRTLIIQDKPSNPTAGIEINLNDSSLSDSYEVGRKIYVMLDGLTVSYDDGESADFIDPANGIPGKYVLGILDGDRVDDIPSTQISKHIFRSSVVEEIIPTELAIADITGANINTLIKLPNTQFLKQDLSKTFAGEANDEFDGLRTIFECGTESNLQLQTSTFSSFSSNVVPQGSGTLTAVLSKDFRSEFLVAIVNTPIDINFSEPTRCDPAVLECDNNGPIGGSKIVFEEDFDSIFTSADLTTAGYTNINTTGGSTIYSPRSFSGARYVQISAFNTGESQIESWLVTPAINLDSSSDEELTFRTSTGFDNGRALTVLVSSDFSGDVSTATWIKIDAILSEGPSSGFSSTFISSGSINLSCLTGDIHIAFKYSGGDGGTTTTYQIDDIKITGN